jgi:UDP-N-acetylglucosamine 1-carboxyvinyltransferase
MPLIPMTLQEQLAIHVPEKRKFRKLSQKQLGQLIGTSQTAIARIEKGRGNPTFDLIQRLANALNLEFTLFVRPQR